MKRKRGIRLVASPAAGASCGQPLCAPAREWGKLRPYVYPDGFARRDTPRSVIEAYFEAARLANGGGPGLLPAWVTSDFEEQRSAYAGCRERPPGARCSCGWEAGGSGGGPPCGLSFYRDAADRGMAWDPLLHAAPPGDPDLSAYYLLASRVDYVCRLLELRWIPRDVRQALAAHLDTHLPLCIHMQSTGRYRDSELESPASTEPVESPSTEYEHYAPRLQLVIHQGELPDLVRLLPYTNFFGKEPETPFFGDEDAQLALAMLVKSTYFRCKGRSIWKILAANIRGSAFMHNCFVRMLACTLLGAYDHCEAVADLGSRMEIYMWFSVRGYPSREDAASLVEGCGELGREVLQEYMFHCISSLPALRNHLIGSGHHAAIESAARRSMDEVRARVYQNLRGCARTGSGSSCFEGVAAIIQRAKDHKLSLTYVPTSTPFVDHVVSCMKKIDDVSFAGALPRDERASGERAAVVREVLSRFDPWDSVSYEWLACVFKVRLDSVVALKDAERLYVTESSTADVANVLRELRSLRPYDYEVLEDFFVELQSSRRAVLYPLPAEMVLAQIAALHRLYGTAPGEELHPEAGAFFVCGSCFDVKACLVEHEDPNGKNVSARGSKGALIDTMTLEVRCAKKESKGFKKKSAHPSGLRSLGYFDEPAANASRKRSRKERARAEVDRCKSQPLTKVNLIGQMLVMAGKKKVALCPRCASPTTVKWYKFGPLGFSCRCYSDEATAAGPSPSPAPPRLRAAERAPSSAHQGAPRKKEPADCADPPRRAPADSRIPQAPENGVEVEGDGEDAVTPPAPLAPPAGHAAAPVHKAARSAPTRACAVCETVRPEKSMASHPVYTDGKTRAISIAYFCKKHDRWWISQWDRILPLQEIVDAVMNKYRVKKLDTGEMLWVEPYRSKKQRGSEADLARDLKGDASSHRGGQTKVSGKKT